MEQPSKRRKIAQNGDPIPCMLKSTDKEASSSIFGPSFVQEFREREIRRNRKQQRFYRRQDVKVHTALQTATVEVFRTTGDDGIPTPVMTRELPPSPEPTDLPDSSDPPSSPPLSPVEPVEPAEAVEPTEPAEPPPSEDALDPTPEPESPIPSDESADELPDAPADQISADASDQPPDEELSDSAIEPEEEPSDAAVAAADETRSDADSGSSDPDEELPSDADEEFADEDSDDITSSDGISELDTSQEPTTIILPDDLPADETLLTTLVTFSSGSTTWTSLLTIDLESVTTIDALTSSSEPLSDASTSTSLSLPTSAPSTSVSNGSSPSGSDGTGGVVVVATGSPDTTGDESESDGADGGSGDAVDTPEVVGGVVGGIAGLAVILLVALLALRWYRNRRQSSQALPGSESENTAAVARSTGPLAESAFASSAAGMLKQLSRMSKKSQGATSTAPMAQRSFERVSGRKLPSAFSPALAANTSPAVAGAGVGSSAVASGGTYSRTQDVSRPVINPTNAGAVGAATLINNDDDDDDAATNSSDASSYRDSRTNPFVPAGGVSSPGAVVGVGRPSGLDETETIRPSPARTPVIHAASGPPHQHPYSDGLSPPATPLGQQSTGIGSSGGGLDPSSQIGQSSPRPTRPGGGTLGRSLPSFDGSRSSRFTEDV